MIEMWYYTTEGKQKDAVPIQELKRLVGEGTLKPTDMVWKDGMPRWIRASSVKELFPGPMSALDPYFTSTKEPERKEAQAKASIGTPPSAEDGSARKRRPIAAGSERPVRRRETGGGSSMMIVMALFFGGLLLLGALAVGVFILVFAAPSVRDPNQVVILDKDKKDGGPDAIVVPGKDGKEREPKLEVLPPGVLEGSNVQSPNKPIAPKEVFEQKFRVKVGHAASFNVSVLTATAGATKFKMNVVKDSDPTIEYKADPNPSTTPSVQFQLPTTEIVLLRVQNVGTTTNKISIVYNVSK